MSTLAIRCEDLGKQYRLGSQRDDFPTLRDVVARGAKRLWKRRTLDAQGDRFWALKDVSFELQKGQTLGIIGNNGAGKSTLLKLLSRITRPTTGRIRIRGRLASLLEVGTGFHPELTGRENVFLNGAILGMRRAEIRRKFDEIVAFAEIEKFLDTPVKHYSNGMYLRLAFSVAAHLEPELLLIDEVLAVGDAEFQRKCLGRMRDVAREGRTVIFVSHNLGAVQTLCSRGILLRNGTVVADGTASEAVGAYLRFLNSAAVRSVRERTDRHGKGQVRLDAVRIVTAGADPATTLSTGRSAQFISECTGGLPDLECSFTIYDEFGNPVTYFDSAAHAPGDCVASDEETRFICHIDELLLLPGRYRVNVGLTCNGEVQDHIEAAAVFEVEQGELRGRPVSREAGYGSIAMPHQWRTPHTRQAQ